MLNCVASRHRLLRHHHRLDDTVLLRAHLHEYDKGNAKAWRQLGEVATGGAWELVPVCFCCYPPAENVGNVVFIMKNTWTLCVLRFALVSEHDLDANTLAMVNEMRDTQKTPTETTSSRLYQHIWDLVVKKWNNICKRYRSCTLHGKSTCNGQCFVCTVYPHLNAHLFTSK